MSAADRTRNKRGQGERLRAEIVAAATALLERTGDESALTLRAVAREVGITAPSIYRHFDDREAILEAVVTETFGELVGRLRAAIDAAEGPVERLRAGCHAYVAFAIERPQPYQVLFQLRRTPERAVTSSAGSVEEMVGAEAFSLLVESITACLEAGLSTVPSPIDSAIQLWVAMHGLVTLRAGAPGFPWPDSEALLDSMIERLAYLSEAPTAADH